MAKQPLPDSVICIDLTEDDDEDKGREVKLGGGERVRKRRKRTPAAAAAATTTTTEARSSVKTEGAVAHEQAIIVIDDDDNGGGGKIGSCAALQNKEWASEVQVVEPAAPEIHTDASAASATANDDIVLIGTANESRLPHMRQHCLEHKFVKDIVSLNRQSHMTATKRRELQDGKAGNVAFCDLCFCYVCDKPANECTSWGSSGQVSFSSHCHASDVGIDAHIWKKQRTDSRNAPATVGAAPQPVAVQPTQQPRHTSASFLAGKGPFEPDNSLAASNANLTKCRKCGWYNRFDHFNFSIKNRYHPVGFLDWCHSCGRVASEQDFGKVQAQPYTRKPGDVFLGTKKIPFTIVAHDPRNFNAYKQQWDNHEGSEDDSNKWTMSESEMQQDVFRHRLGKHPTLEMILASIPIVPQVKIPKSGSTFMRIGGPLGWDDGNYYDVHPPSHRDSTVSADETEAVIVKHRNHVALLEELFNFRTIGYKKDPAESHRAMMLDGDITASWDATERRGIFTVRIFLNPSITSLSTPTHCVRPSLTKFIGTWFETFPFSLSTLSGPIRAKSPPQSSHADSWRHEVNIPVPPFEMSASNQKAARENATEKLRVALSKHNKRVNANLAQLSLNSSAKGELLGGVCATETGLEGILKSYCRETFAEDVISDSELSIWQEFSWDTAFKRMVASSTHRSMRKAGTSILPRPGEHRNTTTGRNTHYESYTRKGDHIKVASSFAYKCEQLVEKTTSLQGLLNHLENLHHSSVPFVEGLNVELLEFQRQSVQWALERETTPGGVQSYLWAKLPSIAEPGQELYYNPILERFRHDQPQLVRGGIIAEEMGLGKTVISLALILQNPAPDSPASGSPIGVLNSANNGATSGSNEEQVTWDKNLYARTASSNDKRGSILSRGTLVVCHVSLVGQWIDEAKSKLKDPGLVYPYHGQSRKRDAATLAQNSIVVTTYQTLASDSTYHAKKGGDGYCAPCEQIRWWRIICDESHSLREASTKKSMAVMNLVADHKWLVSGTPVNTTLNDLKNQLKYLGLEDVEAMFKDFSSSVFDHIDDQARKNRGHDPIQRGDRAFGHFVFLMRTIMVRHTQNQTYRGTTTTLMSLPPKVERSLEIEFSEDEKKEYSALDDAARTFYTEFKAQHRHKLSKFYLRLTQKLTPLRIAASGGQVPLDDVVEDEDPDDSGQAAEEPSSPKKKKARKETQYSDFAYNSKVNALVVELKRARDKDPHSKSLVFSQFSSTLKWLQQELPKHGFQYRTLSGNMSMKKRAQALHDFQHDPPTTIFLLSLRAGAVGINLTQANRVFLMEPSFNPAVEAQAIGRVHRLGQKRNVEVVRLVMKNSIEERIHKMLKKKYGAKPNVEALVGSIQFDKTAVLAEEFDVLFGVAGGTAASASDAEPVTSASI